MNLQSQQDGQLPQSPPVHDSMVEPLPWLLCDLEMLWPASTSIDHWKSFILPIIIRRRQQQWANALLMLEDRVWEHGCVAGNGCLSKGE